MLAIMEMTSRIYLITLSRSRLIAFCLLWLSVALGPLGAGKPETKLTTTIGECVCRFVCLFFCCMLRRGTCPCHDKLKLKFNYKSSNYSAINHNQLSIYIEAFTIQHPTSTLYVLYIIYIGH